MKSTRVDGVKNPDDMIVVHFRAWSQQWDIVLSILSPNIAPPYSKVNCYLLRNATICFELAAKKYLFVCLKLSSWRNFDAGDKLEVLRQIHCSNGTTKLKWFHGSVIEVGVCSAFTSSRSYLIRPWCRMPR